MKIEIRKEIESDYFETEAMVRRSFYNKYAPGCDEHLMVHTLRTHPLFLEEFSRVAVVDGKIAGLIMYFMAKIVVDDREIPVPSFGPLCADHKYKNHGIGSKLLNETLPLLKAAGYPGVIIMGEPEYYPKFGFMRAGDLGLTDAQGNVFDAFMALEFEKDALRIPGGKFIEPEDICSFDDAELAEFDQQFPYLLKAIRPCQWPYDNANDERDGYHLEYATKYPREFENLFDAYLKELAEYDPELLNYTSKEFVDEIRESVCDASYVVCVGDQIAGLFVSSVPDQKIGDKDSASYLQELYIAPGFRKRGIAKDIFLRFIKSQIQDTGFCMVEESSSGKYFKRLLEENGYTYDLYEEDHVRVFCHVYV